MADGLVKEGARSRAKNRARWLGHARTCAGSGLSAGGYCRREGLQYNSSRRWRLTFRDAGEDFVPAECGGSGDGVPARGTGGTGAPGGSGHDESSTALFAEVAVRATSAVVEASPIEVVLAGERRIRVSAGFDEATLRRLVAALEDVRC